MFETVLDNQIETVQASDFLSNVLEEVKTPFDLTSLAEAVKKRSRQDARRLTNWTGAHHVESKAAD